MSITDPSTSESPYRALAKAFYARVEHDAVLRPLFPGSFRCAIEGLAMFLTEFLGGPREHTAARWSMSLAEMHERFKIGPLEREHWLDKMLQAMDDVGIGEPARGALMCFFESASGYMVDRRKSPIPAATPFHEDVAKRWDSQWTLEEAAAAIRKGDMVRGIALTEGLDGEALLFLLGVMSGRGDDYASAKLRADPALARGRYSGGRTLLHEASGNGNIAMVGTLLELGADPNAVDSFGHAPLYYAGNMCGKASGGEVVRALVEAGAHVNANDGVQRTTALHMAARRGYVSVAEALLDCGADIEARDRSGATPLRRAVNCRKARVAELLVSRGANS